MKAQTENAREKKHTQFRWNSICLNVQADFRVQADDVRKYAHCTPAHKNTSGRSPASFILNWFDAQTKRQYTKVSILPLAQTVYQSLFFAIMVKSETITQLQP